MDVKRLQYFCTVVEQGQISRAAKMLHMSQSPLSQRLKELEAELGMALIARGHGQWEVTEAGRLLYEQAKAILADLDNLKSRVADLSGEVSGQVHIGVSTTCEARLLSLLPGLYEKYPKLRCRISVLDSGHLEAGVKEGSLDLAVLLLPLESEDCLVYRLPPGGFSLVFNPLHAFTEKKQVRLEDLSGLPLMLARRGDGGGTYSAITRALQEKGLTPEIILDSENVQTLLRLVDIGMPAAAVVPSGQIVGAMRERLRVVPLADGELKVCPAVIVKKGRFCGNALRCVLEAVLEDAAPERGV